MGKHIGYNNLKKIRKELGLSQQEFADSINMSVSGYGKVERGVTELSVDTICAIKNKYGFTTDYILFGTSSEIDDVWAEFEGLNARKKVDFLLRVYAYHIGIYGEENVIKKCSELAENIDKEFVKRQDGEV